MEQTRIRELYKGEQRKLTRKSGRVFSILVFLLFAFLAFLEYKGAGVNEVFVIRSLVGSCFAAFLLLSFTYQRHDKWAVPAYSVATMLALAHYMYLLLLKESGAPLDENIKENIELATISAFLICAGASFGAKRPLSIYYAAMAAVFNVASAYFPEFDARQSITMNSIIIFSILLMELFRRKDYESFARLQMLAEREEELSRKNRELIQLNKYVNDFTSSFSQQMKRPIRNATSFTNLMSRKMAKGETELATECGEYVISSLQDMDKLVGSLQIFSDIEKHKIQLETIDLQAVFSDALEEELLMKKQDEVAEILNRNKASAKVRIDPMPLVYGDPVLLAELARNLVSNALKYSSKEELPLIRVGMENRAGEQVFFIEDNGVGFDEEHKGRIFHLFQRLHSSSEFKGAGVGLAVAERVVQLHQGRIWASSKEGEGARISFTIPTQHQAASPSD